MRCVSAQRAILNISKGKALKIEEKKQKKLRHEMKRATDSDFIKQQQLWQLMRVGGAGD